MTRKDLELRLKVVADSQQGVAAMNQLAQSVQKVEQAGDRAEKKLTGLALRQKELASGEYAARRLANERMAAAEDAAYNRARYGNVAGGAMNAMPSIGTLGMGAAAFGLLESGLRKGTDYFNRAHDSFATGWQGARGLWRSLPLGETSLDFFDAARGRNDLMAREDLRHQQALAAAQGGGQLAAFRMGFNPRQAGLAARAAGLANAAPMLEGYSDRSTALGEREFQEKQRLLQVDREIAKAERESAAASAQRAASEKEVAKIQREAVFLSNQRSRLVATRPGGGVERQTNIQQTLEIQERIGLNAQKQQQAAQQLAASREQEARSAYATGGLRVQRLNAEAGILEGKADSAAAGATRLGGMDPFRRSEAVYALELLQRFGPDAIGPEMLAAAQSVAPQTVARLLQSRGERTGEFARLRQLAPAEYGDVGSLRGEAAGLRDEAVKLQLELDKKLAEAAADAGEKLGDAVTKALEQAIDKAIGVIVTRLLQGKNRES